MGCPQQGFLRQPNEAQSFPNGAQNVPGSWDVHVILSSLICETMGNSKSPHTGEKEEPEEA